MAERAGNRPFPFLARQRAGARGNTMATAESLCGARSALFAPMPEDERRWARDAGLPVAELRARAAAHHSSASRVQREAGGAITDADAALADSGVN
jgi:hypothetical protein